MRRRGANRRGIRSGGGGLPAPLLIQDLAAWYRADRGVTLTSGVVSAWADQSSNGKTLSQGTAGARPTPVDSHASFGGRPTLSFDGGDHLVAATVADWNFLHDGSGCTVCCVAKSDAATTAQVVWGTNTASNGLGAQYRFNTTDGLIAKIGNGAADVLGQTLSASAGVTAWYASMRYEEGRAGNESSTRYDGASVATGDSGAAPSASDADGALTMGARVGAVVLFTGDVAEWAAWSRYITDAEMAQWEAYVQTRYGL